MPTRDTACLHIAFFAHSSQCLIEKAGYKYLDVRPTLELEEVRVAAMLISCCLCCGNQLCHQRLGLLAAGVQAREVVCWSGGASARLAGRFGRAAASTCCKSTALTRCCMPSASHASCLQVGKWRGCINVPLINSSWKYNAETRKKEVVKEDNLDFIAQVGML